MTSSETAHCKQTAENKMANGINVFMPTSFSYELLDCDIDERNQSQFKCTVRAAVCNEGDVKAWMTQFEALTKTQWLLRSSKTCGADERFVVNRVYVCHHNDYRKVG